MTIKPWEKRLADLPSGYHSNAKPHYMQAEIDELRAALECVLKDRVTLASELQEYQEIVTHYAQCKICPNGIKDRVELASTLHEYEEIAEFYAKCNISPDGLKGWVIEATRKLERLTAGDVEMPHHPGLHTYTWTKLELESIKDYGDRRAAAALLAERERCAKVCDEIAIRYPENDEQSRVVAQWCAEAIRKGTV